MNAALLKTTPTRGHARNIHIRSPCWITNPTSGVSRGRGESRRAGRIINRRRYRDEIVNASSLAASCDISVAMSRNWLGSMRSHEKEGQEQEEGNIKKWKRAQGSPGRDLNAVSSSP